MMSTMVIFCILIICQENQTANQTDWYLVQPPGLDVTVEMPSVPRFTEKTLTGVADREEIIVRSRSAVIDEGQASLTFVYHTEPERPKNRDQIDDVLNGAVIGAMALVNGDLITQREIFVDKIHKGRDFVYTCEVSDARQQTTHQMKIRSKVVLIGQRLFSLNYIALKDRYDDDIPDTFFESFKVVKSPKDLPPRPRRGRARELAEEK